MSTAPQWFRLMYPCPVCKRLPAVHLSDELRALVASMPEDKPVLSYQCQRPTCRDPRTGRRSIFIVAAYAIQRAEPVEQADAA